MVWPVTTGPGSSRAITRPQSSDASRKRRAFSSASARAPCRLIAVAFRRSMFGSAFRIGCELAEAVAEPGDAGVEAAAFHVQVAPVDEQVAPGGHVFGHAGPGGQGLFQHRLGLAVVDLGLGGVLRRRVDQPQVDEALRQLDAQGDVVGGLAHRLLVDARRPGRNAGRPARAGWRAARQFPGCARTRQDPSQDGRRRPAPDPRDAGPARAPFRGPRPIARYLASVRKTPSLM